MDRSSRSLAVCAAAGLLLGCSGDDSPRSTPSHSKIDAPTVVLISIDTLRADRLGCYGQAAAGTPAIDRLAAEGARFASAQTTAPLTLPAHSSLLTGRSLPAHTVLNNGTFELPGSVPTLAEAMRDAGFATGGFVSSPVLASRYGLARGFDRYDDQIARPQGPQQGLIVHYDERAGRETASRAVIWADGVGAKPVFLFVHLWEPHAPYHPPAEFAARFPNDRYQAEVSAADDAVGRLVDGLRALGRTRLLVVVTADHGEGLGEHGEPTHGLFLYRETMRVPLVIHGPEFGIRPAVIDQATSLADVAPTLLDLLGIKPLPSIDGLSNAARLRGGTAPPTRSGVFAESHLPQLEFGWSGLRALVGNDGTRLIDAPRVELYDEAADPAALEDLAAARKDEVAAKRRVLADLVAGAKAHAPEEASARVASAEELETLRSLGYAATGRHGSSERLLVDPGAVDPKDRVTFVADFDLASARTREGRHQEALALYARLLTIEPDNPGLLLQAAQAQILAGQLAAAEKGLRRAVAVDPRYGLAWYRLAVVLDNTQRRAEAEAAYREAIRFDPSNLEPRKALGAMLAEAGRLSEAIDVLQQAKELDPQDPVVARDLERLWQKSRQPARR